jgi:superfamily II DNA/RNA helicase
VALHGALSQGLRNRRLMALRNGQVQILVATDVAARGIDVPTITHVFNFGLPMKAEDYTHRIGRTGRAGRDGLAITFAEFRDRRKIFDIESYTRQQLKAEVIPGLEPTQRFPSARAPQGSFSERGARAQAGRDRGYAGASRSDGRSGFNDSQRVQGAPESRAFAPRRDAEGFGRKPGFGDAGRGASAGARGDFAPRKPAFAKPGAPAGKSFTPHDARKRPARPAR